MDPFATTMDGAATRPHSLLDDPLPYDPPPEGRGPVERLDIHRRRLLARRFPWPLVTEVMLQDVRCATDPEAARLSPVDVPGGGGGAGRS